jgi:hypothetical protein
MHGRLKKERTALNPRQTRITAAILANIGASPITITVHDGTFMKDYTVEDFAAWSSSRKSDGRMAMARSGACLRCNVSADGTNALNKRPLLPKMVDAIIEGLV